MASLSLMSFSLNMSYGCFFLSLGTLLAIWLPTTKIWLAWCAIVLSIVAWIGIINRQNKPFFYQIVFFLGFTLAGFCSGFWAVKNHPTHHFWDNFPEKTATWVEGRLVSVPEYEKRRQVFWFELSGEGEHPKALMKLSWYSFSETPKLGEFWRFKVMLKRPVFSLNPKASDLERFYFAKSAVGKGYIKDGELLKGKESLIDSIRFQLYNWLDSLSLKQSGILKALLIGIKEDITSETNQILMATGTSHLMAISGLHIGLIAFLGFCLGRTGWRLLPGSSIGRETAGFLTGGLGAIFYALLAGMSISTQRALGMLMVVIVGYFLKRLMTSWDVFFLTLAMVLVIDPIAGLQAGFWLSFGAVAIILFSLRRPMPKWLSVLRIQGYLWVGMLPLSMMVFGFVSWIAPFANLWAIPLVSFLVVPAGLLGVLFEHLGVGGEVLIHIADWGMDWAMHALHGHVNLFDGGGLYQFGVNWPGLLLIITVVCILLWRFNTAKWFALFLIALMLLPQTSRLLEGEVALAQIDVGQGSAYLLRTKNHTLLFDAGPSFGDEKNAAAWTVLPALQALGVTKIDKVMISHSDSDHIGGLPAVLEAFAVQEVLNSSLEPRYPGMKLCFQGLNWEWDGVKFEVLWPLENELPKARSLNRSSCVLKIMTSKKTILLTGDIPSVIEKKILKLYPELSANLITVPHHGSNDASSGVFLNQIKPEIALLSVGYLNQFRHPHPRVLERYQKLNTKIYDSPTYGFIELVIGNGIHVKTLMRKESLFHWRMSLKEVELSAKLN